MRFRQADLDTGIEGPSIEDGETQQYFMSGKKASPRP
jgi:hypothetical protein